MTRSQLVRATGLSVPTISSILRGLEQRHLVARTEAAAGSRGRKAEVFELAQSACHALAVHVAVQSISVAVVDLGGSIRLRKTVPARYLETGEPFVRQVAEVTREAVQEAADRGLRLDGVGVSFPGVVDEESRISLAPNIGGEGLDLVGPLREAAGGLPVFVDNDARLGTLAEIWWGTEPPPPTVVFIMADYGVGAGIAVDGKVLRGKDSAAGDIGHAVIDPGGERCRCGQFGCLETFVSFPALLRRIERSSRLGRPTSLLPEGARALDAPSLDRIVDAALAGDQVARDALIDAGRYLATAVSIVNVLVAPDVVYLGGTISRAFEIVAGPIEEILHNRGPELHRRGARVVPATFRESNSLMGAAALVHQHCLEQAGLRGQTTGGARR